MRRGTKGTVLVVEDEKSVADGFAQYLRPDYDVRVAYTGRSALELLDGTIDVVLLDRNMPGLSGDEIVTRITDRTLTCQVALVSGLDPDFDIIDMAIDGYLCKPVSKGKLRETVNRLIERATLDEQLREYFSLVSKAAVLEQEKDEKVLHTDDRFRHLEHRIDILTSEIDDTLSEIKTEDALTVI